MKYHTNDFMDDHPIGGCLGIIILVALVIFLGPWVVMHAWTLIAVNMFGAPVMPYWTAFFGTWAAHILLSRMSNKSSN